MKKPDCAWNLSDIKDVPKLDTRTYLPGGMTALLDAVGKTIDEVGKRLADTPEEERPEKVIVMIINMNWSFEQLVNFCFSVFQLSLLYTKRQALSVCVCVCVSSAYH